MININKEIIAIFLLIVLALWVAYPLFEGFDPATTTEVVSGDGKYGLRGELLRKSDPAKWFIRPDRQIRLSAGGGEMWESNKPPGAEGIKGCRNVPCPANGYDNIDTCYKCGSACPDKMVIPDIHPHVPN
jgi:hypothetical protein